MILTHIHSKMRREYYHDGDKSNLPSLRPTFREPSANCPDHCGRNTIPTKYVESVNVTMSIKFPIKSHRIILKCRDVSLHSLFHVARCDKCSGQVYVSIDKVWLESDRMTIVLERFLQLIALFVDIAKIATNAQKNRCYRKVQGRSSMHNSHL